MATISLAACDNDDDGTEVDAALSDGRYETTLSAEDIGPQPGDPDGGGEAVITLDREKNQVCVDITVEKVDDINAAHLHAGTVKNGGPIVVPLPEPKDDEIKGCVDVPAQVITNIRRAPGDFFVNVRSRENPGGAVRGQLPGDTSDSPGSPPGLPTVTTTTVPGRPSTSTTG